MFPGVVRMGRGLRRFVESHCSLPNLRLLSFLQESFVEGGVLDIPGDE